MAEDLASAIVTSAGQAATVRVGTVTSLAPLEISLGGTALDMTAVGIIGEGFTVGGPVVLLGQSVQGGGTSGASWVVLGEPATGPVITTGSDKSAYQAVDAQTKGDVAFADVLSGGLPISLTIAKRRTGSRLASDLRLPVFASSAPAAVKFGVSINGADYENASLFVNAANDHETVSGFRHIPGSEGFPAGSYTATVRWRNYAGVGTLNLNNDDILSWRFWETD